MAIDILLTLNELVEAINANTGAMNNQNIILTATATSSCSCIVGTAQDGDDEGIEGGAPPPPIGDITYDDPDPTVSDRKCKAADYLVDWLVDEIFRDILVAHNVRDLAGVGLALALGVAGSLIGSQAGIAGTVVGGIAGLLVGAMAAIVGVNIDIEQIEAVMQGLKQDLICALYEATGVQDAKADFEQVLINDGQLSTAEIQFVMLWLPNALLNLLFFEITTPLDSAAFFDGYTPVVGCDPCVQPNTPDWIIAPHFNQLAFEETATGYQGSGIVKNDGTQFTITSEAIISGPDAGKHILTICTQAFYNEMEAQLDTTPTPSGTDQGQYTRHTAVPGDLVNAIGRIAAPGGCSAAGANPDITFTPTTQNDFQILRFLAETQFSINFSITTPPNLCP